MSLTSLSNSLSLSSFSSIRDLHSSSWRYLSASDRSLLRICYSKVSLSSSISNWRIFNRFSSSFFSASDLRMRVRSSAYLSFCSSSMDYFTWATSLFLCFFSSSSFSRCRFSSSFDFLSLETSCSSSYFSQRPRVSIYWTAWSFNRSSVDTVPRSITSCSTAWTSIRLTPLS